MLMNQILDSSNPLRGQDERSRPLKRSASVASLPTPPRTQHRHSRSRPRTSLSHHDSDGSDNASELDDLGSGYAERIQRAKKVRNSKSISDEDEDSEHSEDESPERKRRRTLRILPGHDEEEEDENVFWTGRGGASCGEKQEKKADSETEECSPSPALLRYRVKAPVSPPPSRRLPSIQPARATSVECDRSSATCVDPVTPPRRLFLRATSPRAVAVFKTPTKSTAAKIWPKRDSPNNPFLVESSDKVKSSTEWDSSDDDEEVVGEARVREESPTPAYEEKPTITYVFRGQKATFHNPLYGLSPEVIAASKLPIDHPDYEAAEACPPRRLFSVDKRRSHDHSRESPSAEGVKRVKVHHAEEHDETPEREPKTEVSQKLTPVNSAKVEVISVIDAGEPSRAHERERRETVAKNRLAPRDGLRAGAVFAERDEPARRAIGPLRSA